MSTQQKDSTSDLVPKAIPPGRDRLQSRLLVGFAVPVLCWLAWNGVLYAGTAGQQGRVYLGMAVAVSVFFGLAAWRLGAATPAAAVCGTLVCFDITILTGRPDGGWIFHSGLSPLIVLFVITHLATRFRRERSQTFADEDRRGRNTGQVIANLGVAGCTTAIWYFLFPHMPRRAMGPAGFSSMTGYMICALAEATADTVSSEIGQAIGGRPLLVVGFRRVPAGTDGAISIAGTAAGIAGAALVAIAGGPATGLRSAEMLKVILAASAGLFFDSLLGATVERRGWIGNDLVNFSSTLFAVAVLSFLQPLVFA